MQCWDVQPLTLLPRPWSTPGTAQAVQRMMQHLARQASAPETRRAMWSIICLAGCAVPESYMRSKTKLFGCTQRACNLPGRWCATVLAEPKCSREAWQLNHLCGRLHFPGPGKLLNASVIVTL